jgi:hypothetical protein
LRNWVTEVFVSGLKLALIPKLKSGSFIQHEIIQLIDVWRPFGQSLSESRRFADVMTNFHSVKKLTNCLCSNGERRQTLDHGFFISILPKYYALDRSPVPAQSGHSFCSLLEICEFCVETNLTW